MKLELPLSEWASCPSLTMSAESLCALSLPIAFLPCWTKLESILCSISSSPPSCSRALL